MCDLCRNSPNFYRSFLVQMYHGIYFPKHPSKPANAKNCTEVRPQIDTPHLLSQRQMQSSAHNDFDAPAIDSRKRDSLADAAISVVQTISPEVSIHICTDFDFC